LGCALLDRPLHSSERANAVGMLIAKFPDGTNRASWKPSQEACRPQIEVRRQVDCLLSPIVADCQRCRTVASGWSTTDGLPLSGYRATKGDRNRLLWSVSPACCTPGLTPQQLVPNKKRGTPYGHVLKDVVSFVGRLAVRGIRLWVDWKAGCGPVASTAGCRSRLRAQPCGERNTATRVTTGLRTFRGPIRYS
jgi:hypothetical protein